MCPTRSDKYLTIETRRCEVHPRDVLLAFAAASLRDTDAFESRKTLEGGDWVNEVAGDADLSEIFPWAFVWAGNLHVGLPYEYLDTHMYSWEAITGSYPKNGVFEEYLNVVAKTYPCVTRSVFVSYNDTAVMGRIVVYCTENVHFTQVEDRYYGQNYDDDRVSENAEPHFSAGGLVWKPHIMEEHFDYIQAKYGLHSVEEDRRYSSYRTDLVDIEVLV